MNARIFSLVLAIAAFPSTPPFSCAETLDAQQKALDLITNTADKICNVVSIKGEANSSEVKGNVTAQLNGLASKLADIGVSGSGSINNEAYQNVVQKDLAATLRDNAACKLKVFDTLQNKLLGSSAAPASLRAAPAPEETQDKSGIPRPTSAHQTCARRPSMNTGVVYCASSVLPPQFGNSYGVQNLFGTASTAWVAGSSGYAIGEWILVEFDEMQTVTSVTIRNGYQKTPDIFFKNSRVKQLDIVASSGDKRQFNLEDRLGDQQLSFNRPVQAKWIALIIRDVFPGTKYTDTAISKLDVHYAAN